MDKDVPLLDFTRNIVLAILMEAETFSPCRVRPSAASQRLRKVLLFLCSIHFSFNTIINVYFWHVPDEIRYDGYNHPVDATDGTQRRYGVCGKCAKFQYIKCNIGLHPKNCFVQYHVKKRIAR